MWPFIFNKARVRVSESTRGYKRNGQIFMLGGQPGFEEKYGVMGVLRKGHLHLTVGV